MNWIKVGIFWAFPLLLGFISAHDDDLHKIFLSRIGFEDLCYPDEEPLGSSSSSPPAPPPQTSNISEKSLKKRLKCLPRANMTIYSANDGHNGTYFLDPEDIGVKVLNGSLFMSQIVNYPHYPPSVNRSTPADCFLLFFYSKLCPFSASAAPTYNALPRLFPDLEFFALHSGGGYGSPDGRSGLNTLYQYGVMALPTVLIFHNHRAIYKFNGTDYQLASFVKFIAQFTGMEPEGPVEIRDQDRLGPVPSEVEPYRDIYLYVAWIFTILVGLFVFGKSNLCDKIVETVLNTWREAEIQNQG